MNITELEERLSQQNINLTNRAICELWGMDEASFSRKKKLGSEIKHKNIKQIEEYLAISLTANSEADNSVLIDYININPSCGVGTVVLDDAEVTPVRIGKEIIKDLWKATPENLKLFKASGDSMENIIEDGNVLLVDVSRTDYNNGGIFVLTINNDWFVKRLRLRVTGELDIISDNPKYETETLKPNTDVEIKVVGRVIKNLSRGL